MPNGDAAVVRWPSLIALLALLALGGGGSIAWLANRVDNSDDMAHAALAASSEAKFQAIAARPDPWTGTDAKRQRKELIEADAQMLDIMRRECRATRDVVDARLQAIERDIEQCQKMMETGHARWFVPQARGQ